MRFRSIFLASVFAIAAISAAQTKPDQPAQNPKPKSNKQKKPKNYGFIVLLPVLNKGGSDGKQADLESLLARLGVITVASERGLNVLSPAETQVAEEQMHIDFKDPATWSMDNSKALAISLKASFVFGASIDKVVPQTKLDNKQTYPVHIELSTWAYSFKEDKMLRAQEPFVDDVHVKGDPKKPLSEQGIRLIGIELAFQDAYMKGILEKVKKLPPPEKKKSADG